MDDVLMRAVLAMDVYNRDHNRGIDLRQKNENSEFVMPLKAICMELMSSPSERVWSSIP